MNFLLSIKEWNKVKQSGKKNYTLKILKTLITIVVACSVFFNFLKIKKMSIPMTPPRYILAMVVVPIIIALIYTALTVHFTWKINTIAYETKEKNKKDFRNNVIFSTGLNFPIILAMITFTAENMFLSSPKELLYVFITNTVIGVAIGVFIGFFSWKKDYAKISTDESVQ